MRVRFLEDYDYSPSGLGNRVTIAYKAGMDLVVKKECGQAAISAGKAVDVSLARATDKAATADDGERDGE
ncbi:hypothetical protein GN325_20590 [Agrobacterium vitis]|uniref:hypothetical protein n=1 Tax=Agrobacterium vitis TaxID=373 RepID=UPI0012E7C9AE|nr:hypothetical protein [Agrobacterium vitis]MVB04165.1 hypothetical protein [Agrobacterium vitis]NSY10830.1 hypothetical protein [Agrobacterium vitis]